MRLYQVGINKVSLLLDKRPAFIAYLFVLVIGFAEKITLKGGLLLDSFHNGEFFATFYQNSSSMTEPVFSIHGSVDWLPASLAIFLSPVDRYFGLTFLFYQLLTLLTCLLFVRVTSTIVAGNENAIQFCFFSAVLSTYALDYRDFGLVLTLFLIVELWDKRLRHVHFIIIGIVSYFSFFWYYTRGFISAAVVFVFLFYRKDKRFSLVFFSILVLCLVIPYFSVGFRLPFTLENIQQIRAASAQWDYGKPFLEDRLKQLVTILFVSSVALICKLCWISRKSTFDLFRILVLGILTLGYFPIAVYRMDYQHAFMMTWPVFLLVVAAINKPYFLSGFDKIYVFSPLFFISTMIFYYLKNHLNVLSIIVFLLISIVFLVLLKWIGTVLSRIILLALILLYSINSAISFTSMDSTISTLFEMKDSQRVPSEVRWAASQILRSDPECIFDFTNQGLIAGLVLKPNCTKYAYPIYAPTSQDSSMVNSLKVSKPSAIVLSSGFWSYTIDDKSMSDRYPETAKFLSENYPRVRCFRGTCIGYLSP